MAQCAMQEFPWPLAALCALGGHWLSSLLRPSPIAVPVWAEPETVHTLHEGSSELERVLSLQHELLKLCERPEPRTEAGWDTKCLLLALLLGFVLGAGCGLYAAARVGGGAVATATVRHDSRSVRGSRPGAAGDHTSAAASPSAAVGTPTSSALVLAAPAIGDLPGVYSDTPRRRVGRILA